MPNDLNKSDLQNTIPPWKLPSQPQGSVDLIQSPNQQIDQRKLSKKLLIFLAVIVLLIAALGAGFATGFLNLEKIKEVIPFAQDKKYETAFYEVSLPMGWGVS